MKYYPEIESNFFLSVNDEHSNEVRSLKKKIKTRDDRIEELEYDLNCANASVYELEDKVSKLEEILNYFKKLWQKFIEFLYLMVMILRLFKTIQKIKMILIEIYSKPNIRKFVIMLIKKKATYGGN